MAFISSSSPLALVRISTMYIMPPKTNHCELCKRSHIALTKHHLIPKSQHRKNRTKKTFTKAQCITHIAWLCRPCHSMIHQRLSEKELAKNYPSIEQLLKNAEVSQFIAWVSDKPATFKPKF